MKKLFARVHPERPDHLKTGLALAVILLLCLSLGGTLADVVSRKASTSILKDAAADRPVKGRPSYGGTLVWGTTNPPTIINPILTYRSVSAALVELIFDSLVRVNGKGQVIPDLAESWDISRDGLVYTFHLRKGVRFHDGVECTAEDVKFTYDAIADERNRSPLKRIDGFQGQWEVVDEYTLKLVLQERDDVILFKLVRQIAPKHLLGGRDLAATSFNDRPVGTGPFVFKKWDKAVNEIELDANPHYFEGRPYLDKVVVKVYPDNTALWAALMRREVDFVKFLNQEDYFVLQKDPVFRTYENSMMTTCVIVYNLEDPILSDLKVREAIAQGVDVKKILKGIASSGMESTGPFQPGSPWFNPDVKPFRYNPLKARAILGQRGWKDTDGDGILEKAGRKLEIRMLVDSRSEYFQRIAMMVRQQLSEVGIKVEVRLYKDESELSKEFMVRYKPQAWLRFFSSRSYSVKNTLEKWYPSVNFMQRLWNYRTNKIDELLVSMQSVPDETRRDQIYQKIQKIMYENQPACFLFSPTSLHAVAAKFRNTEEFFSSNMPVYSLKSWYRKN
jgi:peptide/nickel transport system substrate-binding protein